MDFSALPPHPQHPRKTGRGTRKSWSQLNQGQLRTDYTLYPQQYLSHQGTKSSRKSFWESDHCPPCLILLLSGTSTSTATTPYTSPSEQVLIKRQELIWVGRALLPFIWQLSAIWVALVFGLCDPYQSLILPGWAWILKGYISTGDFSYMIAEIQQTSL